ncbi:MAG: hypothetical protein ABSG25_06840 [Bryobacteraceae bacterium]
MPLPDTVRVKISSEAAGSIALTAVVVRDIPIRELVEMALASTGKDATRVRDLLKRGTLVSGASRLRWSGWEATSEAVEQLLATFPDSEPSRAFEPRRCTLAVLRGPSCRIEIAREAGAARRWLRRTAFWDLLLEAASANQPIYRDYSYKDRADRYITALAPSLAAALKRNAGLLKYSALEAQVRRAEFDRIEFHVARAS